MTTCDCFRIRIHGFRIRYLLVVLAVFSLARHSSTITVTALSLHSTTPSRTRSRNSNRQASKSTTTTESSQASEAAIHRQKQQQQQQLQHRNDRSLKFELQKCSTAHDVLQRVGTKLVHMDTASSAEADGHVPVDPTLPSLVLVRLAKQLIALSNRQDGTDLHHQNEDEESGSEGTPPEWKREMLQEQDAWRNIARAATDALLGELKPPTQSDENQRLLRIESHVESIKSMAVIARILPSLSPLWHATWLALQTVVTQQKQQDGWVEALQPHHLSGLIWASDCFNSVSDQQLHNDNEPFHCYNYAIPPPIRSAYQSLDLPFRIRVGCLSSIPKTTPTPPGYFSSPLSSLTVSNLVQQVSFVVDDIQTTSTNRRVRERRQTAWQGDDDNDTFDGSHVGPFHYSGKSMPRQPWSPLVRSVRDMLHSTTGQYYNGCLLNLYPDGDSGMRYHIDPDQGVLWDFHTAVVSVGATRKFAFRKQRENGAEQRGDRSKPHTFVLMDGDVTEMFGDCQQRFQHTVKTAEDKKECAPRSSLVFKRTFGKTAGREKRE